MLLETFKISFKIFLIIILIIIDPLPLITFTHKVPDSQIISELISIIGTKIWNEMSVFLRKRSKNAFKRKTKQTLFEILASEDSYIDLPEIV